MRNTNALSTAGYDCPLDNLLFSFKGINGEQFNAAVRAAKTFEEIGRWLQSDSQAPKYKRNAH